MIMMLSTRFNIVYVCVHAMCPASLRHVLLLRAGLPLVLARRLLRHLHGPRAAAYADERGSAHKTPTSDVIRVTETRYLECHGACVSRTHILP
jgi:hypothetical protein